MGVTSPGPDQATTSHTRLVAAELEWGPPGWPTIRQRPVQSELQKIAPNHLFCQSSVSNRPFPDQFGKQAWLALSRDASAPWEREKSWLAIITLPVHGGGHMSARYPATAIYRDE